MDFNDKIRCYFSLLDNLDMQLFLAADICNVLADNIHLATVFVYFLRAKLEAKEYNPYNFFVALYLSHDVHDEVYTFKLEIMNHCLGHDKSDEKKHVDEFLSRRFKLFERLDFNTSIKYTVCLNLFKSVPHKIWDRIRRNNHVGVCRENGLSCTTCHYPCVVK